MNTRHILLLILFTLIGNTVLLAGYEDFKAISRLDYYTSENIGQVIVFVPEDMLDKNISIDLVYKYEHLTKGVGLPKGLTTALVPFPLQDIELGADTITCSFYADNQWVASAYVIIKKFEHQANAVKIDRYNGGLFVDGLPFFPFGFYTYSPVQSTLPEEELVKGFNMISPYQKISGKARKGRKQYMDRCAALGMKVHYNLLSLAGGGGPGSGRNASESALDKLDLLKEEILAFKDHPALLAWYISDEPVGQGVAPQDLYDVYNTIKELDPYHPVSIVFMTPSKASEYSGVMDIVMADPYPIPHNPVTEVAEITSMLHKEFYPEKPIWIVPQAFGGNEWWQREPTSQEIRAMTYLAIINNASGIQYFIRSGLNSFPKSTTTWNECGAIALEIADLVSKMTFYQYPVGVNCDDKLIHTKAFEWGNIITIMVVNAENKPKYVSLDVLNNNESGIVDVLYEDRQVEIKGGKINDMIDGYGTRVYSWNKGSVIKPTDLIIPENLLVDPGFEKSPMPGIPAACYARIGSDRGATYFTDSRVRYQGFYSLRLNTPVKKHGVNLSFYPVRLNPDQSYTLSVWAKAQDQHFMPFPYLLTQALGQIWGLQFQQASQHLKYIFPM